MFIYRVSMLLLWTLAMLTAAEPACDPETQYLYTGECCQKCDPGTRSLELEKCKSPMCKDCSRSQDDILLSCCRDSNFKWPENSKMNPQQCWCKEGFHCTSASCSTCVPHTECDPGYGAAVIGNQGHDTVCVECPDDTFSDERSWYGTCKQKTRCPRGTQPQGGSSKSDHECVSKDVYVQVIVGAVAVVLIALAVGKVAVMVYIFRKSGRASASSPNEIEGDSNDDLDKVTAENKRTPFIPDPTDGGARRG